MNVIPAWLWFVGGLGLLVGELITPTFFMGIAGVGALVASATDAIIGNELVSLIVFILASGASGYVAQKYEIYSRSSQDLKTGPDRLKDKEGIVKQRIDSNESTGVVKVEGEKWRAKSKYGEVIEEGNEVVIDGIDGTTLVVWSKREPTEPVNSEEV